MALAPVGPHGRGTLVGIVRTRRAGATTSGGSCDLRRQLRPGLYKLYVVDPSQQNIIVLSPADRRLGLPGLRRRAGCNGSADVSAVDDMVIDGDIYVAESGAWARDPGDGLDRRCPRRHPMRPNPDYTMIASPDRPDGGSTKGLGSLYAFDKANSRIVAFTKSNGKYVEQYQLEGHDDAWDGLRDFVVLPGADADAPKTVWWISDTGLHSAVLEQAEGPAATPTPMPGARRRAGQDAASQADQDAPAVRSPSRRGGRPRCSRCATRPRRAGRRSSRSRSSPRARSVHLSSCGCSAGAGSTRSTPCWWTGGPCRPTCGRAPGR